MRSYKQRLKNTREKPRDIKIESQPNFDKFLNKTNKKEIQSRNSKYKKMLKTGENYRKKKPEIFFNPDFIPLQESDLMRKQTHRSAISYQEAKRYRTLGSSLKEDFAL